VGMILPLVLKTAKSTSAISMASMLFLC
jgi:hypothetical protein